MPRSSRRQDGGTGGNRFFASKSRLRCFWAEPKRKMAVRTWLVFSATELPVRPFGSKQLFRKAATMCVLRFCSGFLGLVVIGWFKGKPEISIPFSGSPIWYPDCVFLRSIELMVVDNLAFRAIFCQWPRT